MSCQTMRITKSLALFKKMKLSSILIVCLFLVQCTNNKEKSSKASHSKIDLEIIEQVQEYYINGEGKGFKFEVYKSDSMNELIFWKSEGFTLMRILVPKILSDDSQEVFLYDFNQDDLNDVILSVYREGLWEGGNVSDKEILVFKNLGNQFKLKSVNNSRNLTECNSGQFSLEGIEKGKLIGTSYCYAPEDGHCCPSLEYSTTLLEKEWELKHLKSEVK